MWLTYRKTSEHDVCQVSDFSTCLLGNIRPLRVSLFCGTDRTVTGKPSTLTSHTPSATSTSTIPDASRRLGTSSSSGTSGINNSTHASGILNDAHISQIPTSDLLSSLPSSLDRNYLNFPFLTDRKTFNYLNEKCTKVMFIMRGLSGSGKSSIARMIKSAFKHVVICSADDFFYRPGGIYVFDEALLGAAHETCQKKAKKACLGQVPIVVIDNTNVRRWELRFYTALANSTGYVTVLVEPKTPWRWNAADLAARSLHGVSAEVLERKIAMFDDVIPLYYGWFPNKTHSHHLIRLCLKSFGECLSKLPDFKRDLAKEFRIQSESTDEEITKGILSAYSEGTSSPLLHCTSKFCARGKVPEAGQYHQRSDVQQACGRMFVLQVAGLVFTHKSVGARVSLRPSESALFSRPEETDWDLNKSSASQTEQKASKQDLVNDSLEDYYEMLANGNRKDKKNPSRFLKKQQRKQKQALKQGKPVEGDSVMEKNGRVHIPDLEVSQLETAADESGISKADEVVSLAELFPSLNFFKSSRSAHFTIKTARGVESREVNFDILHACDVEGATSYTKSSFVPVSHGHACYYGDSLCCVYFEKPLHVRTLFSGYY
ncbi:unnamed protein product [Candidula unifasciata]|uniref:2',3'-cyclic-nucleotide 3'-phosphodiesterase n=1 Tax=Candidula unifasciata TaxID=100452 RepID=A0A8S3YMB3_9EUPU|nr:unnamed protein product [Candidula unifasciata]